jgi:hypothetical protein
VLDAAGGVVLVDRDTERLQRRPGDAQLLRELPGGRGCRLLTDHQYSAGGRVVVVGGPVLVR